MLLAQRGGFIQPDFINTLGLDTEYVASTAGWSADLNNETVQQLTKIYEDFTPDGMELAEGQTKDMINVLMLALAYNQAGSTDPYDVREALRALDVDCTTLPIPWNGIEMNEYGQNVLANAFIVQMIDQKYQTVYPAESAAIEAVVPMPGWDER